MKRERDVTDPAIVAGLPLRGLNQWPSELPSFRPAMMTYMESMEALGRRMLAASLDLPLDHFGASFRELSITLAFRTTRRRTVSTARSPVPGRIPMPVSRLNLAQADVRWLDIQSRDGEWFPAPVMPGMFLINIGQILSRWTNGFYPSTLHRAVNLEGVERYSISFFFRAYILD